MKKLLYFVLGIGIFSSCKDEVDVNAPWKDVTVIYGLLAKSDTIHYVKINKAFLGEGSALTMAQIADSNQYNQAVVSIQKIENGVATSDPVISLRDTILSNKEEGTFYAPDHVLYYFKEALDQSKEYLLQVKISDKIAQAKTGIINTFNLSGGSIFGNSVATVAFTTGNKYADQNYAWQSIKYGKAYELTMHFHYDEHYVDGSVSSKTADWNFDTQTAININGGQNFTQKIEGEAFYQFVASAVKPLNESSNVKHRKFSHLSFSMSVAGDDLNTYLQVNKPATGLVFEKPEYTNIENGIGIFSTRVKVTSAFLKQLNDASLIELYGGSYTSDLGFCAASGIYACP